MVRNKVIREVAVFLIKQNNAHTLQQNIVFNE